MHMYMHMYAHGAGSRSRPAPGCGQPRPRSAAWGRGRCADTGRESGHRRQDRQGAHRRAQSRQPSVEALVRSPWARLARGRTAASRGENPSTEMRERIWQKPSTEMQERRAPSPKLGSRANLVLESSYSSPRTRTNGNEMPTTHPTCYHVGYALASGAMTLLVTPLPDGKLQLPG